MRSARARRHGGAAPRVRPGATSSTTSSAPVSTRSSPCPRCSRPWRVQRLLRPDLSRLRSDRGRGRTGTALADRAVRRARHPAPAGVGPDRDRPVRHPSARRTHPGQARLRGHAHAVHRGARRRRRRPAEPVAQAEPGEIVVRGPNVTARLLEEPEAEPAAFDDEGWFHSGRHRLPRRGRLPLHRRPPQGHDHHRRRERLPRRGRAGPRRHAGCGRRRASSAYRTESGARPWSRSSRLAAGSEVTLEARPRPRRAVAGPLQAADRAEIVEAVPRNASGKLDKIAIRSLLRDGS